MSGALGVDVPEDPGDVLGIVAAAQRGTVCLIRRRALRMLRRAGLTEDAIVVVTSDHGEGFLEHGKLLQGFAPYDEVHRVPLLIRMPEGRRSGVREVSSLVGLVDVLPTLVDLAGLPPGDGDMGRSLVPLLEGSGGLPDRPVFSETAGVVSLRTDEHKLIRFMTGRELFYDIAADPGEHNALPCDEACTDLGAQLDDLIELLHLTGSLDGESVDLDETDIERLRALGYLNN